MTTISSLLLPKIQYLTQRVLCLYALSPGHEGHDHGGDGDDDHTSEDTAGTPAAGTSGAATAAITGVAAILIGAAMTIA